MDTVTIISELREDHQWVLDNPLKGHRVALDHREMPFMRQLGLTEDPTIDNLLTFNTEYGGWQEPLTVTQTVVFGVPALSVKTSKQNGNWTNALIGFLDDEAFLLFVIVPSEETLNNFLATWTRMLESIKPTK